MADTPGGLAGMFGELGGEGKQLFLWGILVGLAAQLVEPLTRELGFLVNSALPNQPVPPETAATLAQRGLVDPDTAAKTAEKQGVGGQQFTWLRDAASRGLATGDLAEALRRGLLAAGAETGAGLSFTAGLRLTGLRQEWWPVAKALATHIPTVADVMTAYLEGQITETEARDRYAKAGGTPTWFESTFNAHGEAPTPEEALEMLRRGIIEQTGQGPESTSFTQAFLEGPWRNKWLPAFLALRNNIPSVTDVMRAWLEGQITETEARTRYLQAGGTPEWFQTTYNSRGSSPTPTQAIDMARRGLIAWTGTGPEETTYEQAFLEGPWRNKWSAPFKGLARAIPSEYYIMQMVKSGSLTPTFGKSELLQQGYTETVAEGIISVARGTAVGAYKAVTESLIVKLYGDRIITRTDAKTMLGDIGYTPTNATFILETVDFSVQTKTVDSAVSRVGTLYKGRKLTRTQAQQALSALGITGTAADQLLRTLDIERAATVKALTESQYADAFKYTIMDQAEAMAGLEGIGYTPYDAWVVLSDAVHAPLPTQPAKGPGPLTLPTT